MLKNLKKRIKFPCGINCFLVCFKGRDLKLSGIACRCPGKPKLNGKFALPFLCRNVCP